MGKPYAIKKKKTFCINFFLPPAQIVCTWIPRVLSFLIQQGCALIVFTGNPKEAQVLNLGCPAVKLCAKTTFFLYVFSCCPKMI